MGHFLRQLVRLVILKEMKKVTAGGGVGVSWGLGDWVYRGWSMVLQKKSRKSNSTATCVVMDEGGTVVWCIMQDK